MKLQGIKNPVKKLIKKSLVFNLHLSYQNEFFLEINYKFNKNGKKPEDNIDLNLFYKEKDDGKVEIIDNLSENGEENKSLVISRKIDKLNANRVEKIIEKLENQNVKIKKHDEKIENVRNSNENMAIKEKKSRMGRQLLKRKIRQQWF